MSEMSTNSVPRLTREAARALALAAGFAEAGLVAIPYAEEERDASRFADWVRAGHAGTMRYLERKTEKGQLLRAWRFPFRGRALRWSALPAINQKHPSQPRRQRRGVPGLRATRGAAGQMRTAYGDRATITRCF